MRAFDPAECTAAMHCSCFTAAATDKLAKEIEYAEGCRIALAEYSAFVTKTTSQEIQWWQEPVFVVGGIVVSASLALFLGYSLGVSN